MRHGSLEIGQRLIVITGRGKGRAQLVIIPDWLVDVASGEGERAFDPILYRSRESRQISAQFLDRWDVGIDLVRAGIRIDQDRQRCREWSTPVEQIAAEERVHRGGICRCQF